MIRRFFGEEEHPFALTPETIAELERKLNAGIAEIYGRVMGARFRFGDLVEIIRLGLIGGGMNPQAAMALVDTYAKPRPVMELYPTVIDILDMAWNGTADLTKESEE
jgi:hypothetical protein